MKATQTPRRRFLTLGAAALAVISASAASGGADAATNAALRTSLKYQDKPKGDRRCANCMQFMPGVSAKALGACKIMAGDTEISPQGYCLAWGKKP